ncbi:MAG TPA: PrsW family intramembrane metalloprotease [Candidatus Binatia bacterium]
MDDKRRWGRTAGDARAAEERVGLARSAVLVLLAGLAWRAAGTPVAIVLAALVPAVLYAALLATLGRRAGRPPSLLAAAFLWGAVPAALLASTGNNLLQAWMAILSSASDASIVVPRLGAPIVEELAKGAALVVLVVVWPAQVAGAADGIVYGGLVGLGFAVNENLLYLTMAALQDGYAGLLRGAFLRGAVYGMNHAVFTAMTGAAVGWARATASRAGALVVSFAGFAAAVAVHVLWNTIASDAISRMLCAAPAPGGACQNPPPAHLLYVNVPLIVVLFVGPCIAALLAVGRLSRARLPGA